MRVLIDGVEYIKKPGEIKPPKNEIDATHWAVLPDGQILLYKIDDDVRLWMPRFQEWVNPTIVPYTLYSFDDFGA